MICEASAQFSNSDEQTLLYKYLYWKISLLGHSSLYALKKPILPPPVCLFHAILCLLQFLSRLSPLFQISAAYQAFHRPIIPHATYMRDAIHTGNTRKMHVLLHSAWSIIEKYPIYGIYAGCIITANFFIYVVICLSTKTPNSLASFRSRIYFLMILHSYFIFLYRSLS